MSFCQRSLHWEENISHYLLSFSVIPHSQVSPLLPSSHRANHVCTNWYSNLQETISAEERTFPIMSHFPLFFPLFYLSALQTIKHLMNCDAISSKRGCHFPLAQTLKVTVELHCALTKHEFNDTKAHLAFNQSAGFTLPCTVIFLLWWCFPSHRLLCCAPLDRKKNIVQLRCWGVYVFSLAGF